MLRLFASMLIAGVALCAAPKPLAVADQEKVSRAVIELREAQLVIAAIRERGLISMHDLRAAEHQAVQKSEALRLLVEGLQKSHDATGCSLQSISKEWVCPKP